MWTSQTARQPRTLVRIFAFALAIAAATMLAACSSNDEDDASAASEVDSSSEVADASDIDDDYVAPSDYVGYQITGDAGVSVNVLSEVQAAAYTPEPTKQVWDLQGQPVYMLFDESVVSGRITFEVTAGETAHFSIIRGFRDDPTSNLSPVTVTKVLAEADVAEGGVISLDFDVRDDTNAGDESGGESEVAPSPEPADEEVEEAEG